VHATTPGRSRSARTLDTGPAVLLFDGEPVAVVADTSAGTPVFRSTVVDLGK
jgi:hypothetical protein